MSDKEKKHDAEPNEEKTDGQEQKKQEHPYDGLNDSEYIDPYHEYYEHDDTVHPEDDPDYYTDRHPYYEDSADSDEDSKIENETESDPQKKDTSEPEDKEPKPPKKKKDGSGGGNGGDDGGDEDDDDENEREKKMPFLAHLEELRWTIVRSLIAIVLAAIVAFFFSDEIIRILRYPAPDDLKLIYLSPTEGFLMYIKVSIFAGLIIALPYVAWEVWKFVVPGLLDKERKLVLPIVFFTVLCFATGAVFAYFVILKFGLNFLLGFADPELMVANLTIGKYLGFCVTIILVFGVVFELPVMSFFLSTIGILSPGFLRKYRKHGIVVIFIMAAMLTPPDIVTQLMLAGPLILLYEVSVWVSAAVARKRIDAEDDD